MAQKHVIVGAGATGRGTAAVLAEAGHEVMLVSRGGTDPAIVGVTAHAADAANPAALSALSQGAHALYNCANPPYHKWASEWPPLADSFLQTAEETGAILVTMNNLYGYGPVAGTMTEETPLAATYPKGRIRAQMWRDAKAAHDAGRIRATEARASDFVGPGLGQTAHMGDRVVPRVLEGKKVSVIGNPDVPHTWSAINDVCKCLATLGTDERALGRAWHVPSAPPMTQRELITVMCEVAGVAPVAVNGLPKFALTVAGVFSPTIRELKEILYQFEQPFIMDSSRFSAEFGVSPTPTREIIAATVADYRRS